MFFYEGLSCPVCECQFQPGEDIVSCPHCGLPHHRRCWQQTGHCHLQHLHDTPQQWTRDSATQANTPEEAVADPLVRRCAQCGAENPEYAEFCKRCGRPISQAEWQSAQAPDAHEYTPFPVNAAAEQNYVDDELIDGVPARDYAAVVGQKASYYVPKFKELSTSGKGGWNWAAFLLGPYWLLYRKMYVGGALLLLLQFAEMIITEYVFRRLDITTYEHLYNAFERAANNRTEMLYLLSIWLISAIILLLRFVIGISGNRLYKQHCAGVIQRSRERVPDLSTAELATTGGTSMGIALIGYCALSVLSQLVVIILA